jgi:predicted nucleic acid-binding protein
MRIFLDANVLFSGLYSNKGAPSAIIARFTASEFEIIISEQVLQEVIAAFNEKSPATLALLDLLLNDLPPEIVPDPNPLSVLKWKGCLSLDDAVIMAAAEFAQPDFFITGDKHFLRNPTLSAMAGIRIVTPAQFLEILNT